MCAYCYYKYISIATKNLSSLSFSICMLADVFEVSPKTGPHLIQLDAQSNSSFNWAVGKPRPGPGDHFFLYKT